MISRSEISMIHLGWQEPIWGLEQEVKAHLEVSVMLVAVLPNCCNRATKLLHKVVAQGRLVQVSRPYNDSSVLLFIYLYIYPFQTLSEIGLVHVISSL